MAQILKGAPVVAAMNEANAARCAALKEKGIVPTLAVVRVGAREDDISYEKGIVTRCGKVGVEVRQFHMAEDVTQEVTQHQVHTSALNVCGGVVVYAGKG